MSKTEFSEAVPVTQDFERDLTLCLCARLIYKLKCLDLTAMEE
jgi:hypothetical protein